VSAAAAVPDVVVLVERNTSIYLQAARGFQEGFSGGGQADIIHLNGDAREMGIRLAGVRQQPPRLVIAIGTQAALGARDKFPNIPILYCLALNPEQNKLTGPNIGGVALDVELSQQMAFVQKALPQAKRIGVVYDEPASGRLVRQAEKYLKGGVRLVARDVKSPSEAARAIEQMAGHVDAFWMLWDPVVANTATFRMLVEFCLANRVALISPAVPFVAEGALLSVGADYREVGRRVAAMAREVLQGRAAGDFKAEPPANPILTVSGKVAQRLGITIPGELLAEYLPSQ
jgi:ABC-type uncharacterized transport system substrate-binding protein